MEMIKLFTRNKQISNIVIGKVPAIKYFPQNFSISEWWNKAHRRIPFRCCEDAFYLFVIDWSINTRLTLKSHTVKHIDVSSALSMHLVDGVIWYVYVLWAIMLCYLQMNDSNCSFLCTGFCMGHCTMSWCLVREYAMIFTTFSTPCNHGWFQRVLWLW